MEPHSFISLHGFFRFFLCVPSVLWFSSAALFLKSNFCFLWQRKNENGIKESEESIWTVGVGSYRDVVFAPGAWRELRWGSSVLSEGFGVVDVGVQLSLLENCTGFPPHTELTACAVCVHLQLFYALPKSREVCEHFSKLQQFWETAGNQKSGWATAALFGKLPRMGNILEMDRECTGSHWHFQTDTFMFLKHPMCSFS